MCWGNLRRVCEEAEGSGERLSETGCLTQELKDSPLLPLWGVRTTNTEEQRQEDSDQSYSLLFFSEAHGGQRRAQGHTAQKQQSPTGLGAQSGHVAPFWPPLTGAPPGPWAGQCGHCWAALGSGLSLGGQMLAAVDSDFCSLGARQVFLEDESLAPAQCHGPPHPPVYSPSFSGCLSAPVARPQGRVRRSSFLPLPTPSCPTHPCSPAKGKGRMAWKGGGNSGCLRGRVACGVLGRGCADSCQRGSEETGDRRDPAGGSH